MQLVYDPCTKKHYAAMYNRQECFPCVFGVWHHCKRPTSLTFTGRCTTATRCVYLPLVTTPIKIARCRTKYLSVSLASVRTYENANVLLPCSACDYCALYGLQKCRNITCDKQSFIIFMPKGWDDAPSKFPNLSPFIPYLL